MKECRQCKTALLDWGVGQAGDIKGFAKRARAEPLATSERASRRSVQTEHMLIPEAAA